QQGGAVSASPTEAAGTPAAPASVAASAAPAAPSVQSAPAASSAPDKAAPAGQQTVTVIDGMSGKRQEFQIPASDPASAAPPVDHRLIEPSRHGTLPRVAAAGARPADVYARPLTPSFDKVSGPRVALVVGGLGIGAAGTFQALAKLPGAVSFAFAPYGSDLTRWVARARSEGHEVLLQVPMEPFDYPDNDPGPQTLLTTLSPAQNVDRLHWFMSRFQGYVGISN